ncbi:MAG: hypothetical protein L6R42_008824 [Xanthoria sp. 1 TBL-2021]|nr:MAG: hypothetical protein L6R42_008824 [Xanthoria sp. 1 TBL-2021]
MVRRCEIARLRACLPTYNPAQPSTTHPRHIRRRRPRSVRSANINAHRSLTLAFRSGDYSPTLPHSLTYLRTRNTFPEHWDTWSAPNFYEQQQSPPLPPLIWLEGRHEIHWAEVQALLPVARADALLKAAGY